MMGRGENLIASSQYMYDTNNKRLALKFLDHLFSRGEKRRECIVLSLITNKHFGMYAFSAV
jgi:hypothetical protein